jgi:hypothetical protein
MCNFRKNCTATFLLSHEFLLFINIYFSCHCIYVYCVIFNQYKAKGTETTCLCTCFMELMCVAELAFVPIVHRALQLKTKFKMSNNFTHISSNFVRVVAGLCYILVSNERPFQRLQITYPVHNFFCATNISCRKLSLKIPTSPSFIFALCVRKNVGLAVTVCINSAGTTGCLHINNVQLKGLKNIVCSTGIW